MAINTLPGVQGTNGTFFSQGTSVRQSAFGKFSVAPEQHLTKSIWVDDASFTNLKKPKIRLKDLEPEYRNGKQEMMNSPFNREDFVRIDGMAHPMQERDQGNFKQYFK